MTIAVDFDGTIVKHRYPNIGEEIPFAVDTLKALQQRHHKLILWSVRKRGLEFYAINRDYPEETTDNNPHFSRKLKVDVFIDDRNLGGLPDWGTIFDMIDHHKTWNHLLDEEHHHHSHERPKRKHWWNI